MNIFDNLENKVKCDRCKGNNKCHFHMSIYCEDNTITGGINCTKYNFAILCDMKVRNETQEDLELFRKKLLNEWNNFIEGDAEKISDEIHNQKKT